MQRIDHQTVLVLEGDDAQALAALVAEAEVALRTRIECEGEQASRSDQRLLQRAMRLGEVLR